MFERNSAKSLRDDISYFEIFFLLFSRRAFTANRIARVQLECKKETCFLPLFSMWSLLVTTLEVTSAIMRRDVKIFITNTSISNLEKKWLKTARELRIATAGTHCP